MQAATLTLTTIMNSFFFLAVSFVSSMNVLVFSLWELPFHSPRTTPGFTLPGQTHVKRDPDKQGLLLRREKHVKIVMLCLIQCSLFSRLLDQAPSLPSPSLCPGWSFEPGTHCYQNTIKMANNSKFFLIIFSFFSPIFSCKSTYPT